MTETIARGAPVTDRRPRRMFRRIISRLGAAVFVVWAVTTLTFIAMRLITKDPVSAILGPTAANTPAARQAIIEQFGFDRPIFLQYLDYLRRTFTGDFGISYSYRQSVSSIITDQAAGTIPLVLFSLILAWAIALAWILLTAGRPRIARSIGSGLEVLAISTPQLWLAILLLLVFSFTLGWFPISDSGGFNSLVLPAFAMAIPLAGYFGQVTREAFESSLEQPFVLTSRSRGASEWLVRTKHVLRHASLPGITLSGFALGWLLSGSVIVETVFGRPGLGATLLRGVQAQDVPLTGAIVLISAVLYVVANLVVDLLYPLIDPRIRNS